MSNIESHLKETRVFKPSDGFVQRALIPSLDQYRELYQQSIQDPEGFWGKQATELLLWQKKWDTVLKWEAPFAQWFVGGKLNVSENCLDRHLSGPRRNKAAIIWEGEPGEVRTLTYQQLHREVCKFANVLKRNRVQKGDRIIIYLPMCPEAAIAMLACARIGAVHSVVFGGFSSEAIKDRLNDSQAKLVITADGGYRRGAIVPLKKNVDEAVKDNTFIERVIVFRRANNDISIKEGRDVWWHREMEYVDAHCEPEPLDSEDPLFILYTSGSTGKPKGILHTTGGYLLGVTITSKYVFELHEDELYWCSADIGWVTGHSYVVYGPLSNGATTFMYEGAPNWPELDRFWKLIAKYEITVFYTAPTAIRAFIRWGDTYPKGHDLSSLRLLGTVGEPINPEAWIWYHTVIGGGRCPIVDTWWQTETGAIMITPLPGATPLKPGTATLPFFGVKPEIVDGEGNVLEGATEGNLCITDSWPGQMRTVFGDHKRFIETYFSTYPGKYFTGDGARRDEDGYWWITGRVDDVINVSGHRMGTAEVESALVANPKVAEAAVVGYPHDIKGQGIYAYVTLKLGVEPSEALRQELNQWVRKQIGPIATPDLIQWAPGLPKTHSGKIMR